MAGFLVTRKPRTGGQIESKRPIDCGEPFKHLNGKMAIEMSIKKDANIASVLKLLHPKGLDR